MRILLVGACASTPAGVAVTPWTVHGGYVQEAACSTSTDSSVVAVGRMDEHRAETPQFEEQ